jgi:hypothetical protein
LTLIVKVLKPWERQLDHVAEILSIVRPAGETRPMVSQTDTIDSVDIMKRQSNLKLNSPNAAAIIRGTPLKLRYQAQLDLITEDQVKLELTWRADSRTKASLESQAKLMEFASHTEYTAYSTS